MLTDAQHQLEEAMSIEAVRRQQKDNNNNSERDEWSNSKAGNTYVRHVMHKTDIVPLIAEFMTPKKGAGRNHAVAHLLAKTGMNAETVAYLTVRAVLNFMSLPGRVKGRQSRASVAIKVAGIVHDEWRVRFFQDTKERKMLIKKLCRDFEKKAYPKAWRKRTIKHYFDAELLDWSGWTKDERIKLGSVLLQLFMKATGYIVVSDCNSYLELSDEFVEHLSKMLKTQSALFVLHTPMIVPPVPWSAEDNLFKGGYLSDTTKVYSIIKGTKAADKQRVIDMDWSQVLPAINAIQETPWRVCKPMVDAVDWAYWELTKRQADVLNYRGIGKMPCCEQEELPPMPWNYHEDEEVKKAHNKACFEVRSRRRAAKGRRVYTNMTLNTAKEFRDYEALYFPHSVDSRGRAYPVPSFLNPQGSDYVKAMLEFAHGEPVDDIRWIAIAGANAYGKDKISLDERVQWTLDNEEMILSIANDYKADTRWIEAGEPFQFLRFCFEWKEYKSKGLGYISHMVIPVDATCSGLQHYAAMLRCEELGRSVNLIPGLSRQDIYGDVANHVVAELMHEGGAMAKACIAFGIDRKITKRQVMVVPYAGKFSSCLNYTREALQEKLLSGVMATWSKDDYDETVSYLAKHIWSAIDAKVSRGKGAMYWLTAIAGAYSRNMNKRTDLPVYDRRMTWNTPDGFEVSHFREDTTLRKVETTFEGRLRLSYLTGTGKLSVRDMSLAVAPNFVHALDATHMRMTVNMAQVLGIKHFAMIHDSFGVHSRFMEKFLEHAVKPAFVEMYERHDVLQEFADRFSSVCKIPARPEQGTLDLQGVLQSEFFFS